MGKHWITAEDNPEAIPKRPGPISQLATDRSELELRRMERTGGRQARRARMALLLKRFVRP